MASINFANNGTDQSILLFSIASSLWVIVPLGLRCVKKIESFAGSLEALNLSKNELADISPVSQLVNLRFLDASENYM